MYRLALIIFSVLLSRFGFGGGVHEKWSVGGRRRTAITRFLFFFIAIVESVLKQIIDVLVYFRVNLFLNHILSLHHLLLLLLFLWSCLKMLLHWSCLILIIPWSSLILLIPRSTLIVFYPWSILIVLLLWSSLIVLFMWSYLMVLFILSYLMVLFLCYCLMMLLLVRRWSVSWVRLELISCFIRLPQLWITEIILLRILIPGRCERLC